MNLMRLMFRAIFKKYWKTLLLIAVISAVGCGVMSGMNSATMSLDNTLQEYIDGYGVPDATITTAITKRDRRLDLLALNSGRFELLSLPVELSWARDHISVVETLELK